MPGRSRRRPCDANQLGKLLVDIAISGADSDESSEHERPCCGGVRTEGWPHGRQRAGRLDDAQRTVGVSTTGRSGTLEHRLVLIVRDGVLCCPPQPV
jgi:hypothetical protein